MGLVINVLLVIGLVYTSLKWFAYYHSTQGLLFYIGAKHGETVDETLAKELTDVAVKRTIVEFFKK